MTAKEMNELLPAPLRKAQEQGIEFFMGEGCEWKLELKGSEKRIEKIVGCPVFVFANNGFGDHLFLKKKPDGEEFGDDIFEFLHEGPEINGVAEGLETLLGLKERPPSKDSYPKAIYETGELVGLGDKVQVKVWAEFWKGWQDGVVEYVPGVSKRKTQHEYKWIEVGGDPIWQRADLSSGGSQDRQTEKGQIHWARCARRPKGKGYEGR